MDNDLSKLLEEWAYEPGAINARMIQGQDGQPRVQIRVDLGILQMYPTGRPDGQTPNGFPSLLEYYEAQHDSRQEEEEGSPAERFSLSAEDCRLLREEAVQYYHRYLALLALEDFEGVIRDTTRNLRVLDLCATHAETEADRNVLEQFRPYILMLRARAMASQALKDNEPKAAVFALDQGLEALRQYFASVGQPQMFDASAEAEMLRGMRESLVPKLPVSQHAELRTRLAKALESENYELAAILRDELKMMGKTATPIPATGKTETEKKPGEDSPSAG
ncbi:MAG: UvrB/UvrC motif-containing protein [Phycisphaerales bacterium]|nr:UvrB/UvrC motif-containing protein [Planctomycetota bacterium]